MAVVKIADVIVPDEFTGYTQQLTEEKSRLIASGAIVRDPSVDGLLAGAGLTFTMPSWEDLDDDEENISNDDDTDEASTGKIGTGAEIAIRLNRNHGWSSMSLVKDLINEDPLAAIGGRVATYWVSRQDHLFIATMNGVFSNNDKATPGGGAVQGDLTLDISADGSGGTFEDGVTNFSTDAVQDTCLTMGDSMDDLTLVFMHSVIYNRALKLNMIDFVPAADQGAPIARFLRRTVVISDRMPYEDGNYETWFFGSGAVRLGVGTPDNATEVERKASAGNGGGQDKLWNRVKWAMHPSGHAYVGGSTVPGGPSNAATSGNLAHADSFRRVFPERKQIKIARLITKEHD